MIAVVFQPERLTGENYTIQSDIWSLGLSLIELAVGLYPIPSPTRYEYARRFGVHPEEVLFDGEAEGLVVMGAGEGDGGAPKTLAIFELLGYIVNGVSG